MSVITLQQLPGMHRLGTAATEAEDIEVGLQGPFRATWIWRSIVVYLRENVRLRKHRYKMKFYDDTFLASEAVSLVLQKIVSDPVFGKKTISRENAMKLCSGLVDFHIFEMVCGSKNFEDGPIPCRLCPSESEAITVSPMKKYKKPAQYDDAFVDPLDLTVNESYHENSPTDEADAVLKEVALAKLLTMIDVPVIDGVLSEITKGQLHESERIIPFNQFPAVVCGDAWLTAAAELLRHTPINLSTALAAASDPPDAGASAAVSAEVKQQLFQLVADFYRSADHSPLIPGNLLNLFLSILSLVKQCSRSGSGGGSHPSFSTSSIVTRSSRLSSSESGGSVSSVSGSRTPRVDVAVQALQLAFTLLSAPGRAHMLRLLDFIWVVSKDKSVPLSPDPEVGNTRHVLNMLSPAIIQHQLLSPANATSLVFYMVKNRTELQDLPEDVVCEVDYHLRLHDACPLLSVAFCQRIRYDEYEKQKNESSKAAVADLVTSVMKNASVTQKEKKQLMKRLQKSHPDIYEEHFSNP